MGNVRGLTFNNYVIYKNVQWFWSLNYNALFSRDMESGEIKRWGEYVVCQGVAYSYVVLYRDKIIAVPHVEKKIMIFEIEAEVFRYIELKSYLKLNPAEEGLRAFFSYAAAGRRLFVIGNETPYILRFNMDTESVEAVLDLRVHTSKRDIYFREAVLDKGKLILPLVEENLIFEIDIETLRWTTQKAGMSQGGFSAICRDEDNLWLIPGQKGAILRWNRENGDILSYEVVHKGFHYTAMRDNFHSGVLIGEKIWVFPFYGNIVLSFDLKTGEASAENAVNRYLQEISPVPGIGKFQTVQTDQERIFLLCGCTGEAVPLMYDPVTDELEMLEWKFEVSCEEYLYYLYGRGLSIMDETEISLKDFTGFVSGYDVEKADGHLQGADNDCGRQIWKTVSDFT